MSEELHEVDKKVLVEACWRAGNLRYLMHSGQNELSDAWKASESRRYVICCSRRFGKSYWLCKEAVEAAIANPGWQIRYAAPTTRMCRSIVEPHIRTILADCPKEMQPHYKRQEGVWTFPNGSEIVMAGCDLGGAERLRGVSTNLALIDEAAFIDDLDYLIKDILLPQFITTNGRLLMVSTPARSPAHPFTKYCIDAEIAGSYQHRTIYDAPHIPKEVADEYVNDAGGPKSTTARREYFGEVVVDSRLAIIPEFVEHGEYIIADCWPPDRRDCYVVADFGYNDLTAVVFGYYDWDRDKIVIEDELEFIRANTGDIAPAIKEKEADLWGDKPPMMRVADAPLQQLADLSEMHSLPFNPARKDDAAAALNALRLAVTKHTLEMGTNCKLVASHFKHGIWKPNRKDYARSGEYGHFDFIDAVKYLVRSVDKTRNPYDGRDPSVTHATHWVPDGRAQVTGNSAVVQEMFSGRGFFGR